MAAEGEKKTLKQVRFEYKFEKTYNPVYVNGAFGGPTTHGELCVNFYLERQAVPHAHIHDVTNEGNVGALKATEPAAGDGEAMVIRFVTTGIVMNVEAAKRIVAFLQRQIKAIEAVQVVNAEATPKKETH